MKADSSSHLAGAALKAASGESIEAEERVQMLAQVALDLQIRKPSAERLETAITLYDRALALCPADGALLRARIQMRRAGALQALPDRGTQSLESARDTYAAAIPVLKALGSPEEAAEAEMNFGLVIQSLAASGKGGIADAISAYHRALATFTMETHPREFAIIKNNLATAFMSMPACGERTVAREALAVQTLKEGLRAIRIEDHPIEYAMLQNNLANALQYAPSSHPVENNLAALAAYDEALKIRCKDTMPLEYASTIANKANCLWNLPDEPLHPERGNSANLLKARLLYEEARELFAREGDLEKAQIAADALLQIGHELLS